jgi:hypothetical protein
MSWESCMSVASAGGSGLVTPDSIGLTCKGSSSPSYSSRLVKKEDIPRVTARELVSIRRTPG